MLGSDGERAGEYLAERDEGLGAEQAHGLQLFVDEMEQVLVVAGIYLHEHVILPGGVVALYHFGHLFKPVNNLVEFIGFLEEHPDEGTGVVAESRRLDQSAGTLQDVGSLQLGDALVDCGTAYATFAGDFQKRFAAVVDQHLENFGVEVINL